MRILFAQGFFLYLKMLSFVNKCRFFNFWYVLVLKKWKWWRSFHFSHAYLMRKIYPYVLLTGNFTQRDCHRLTLSYCYSVFFRKPPMSHLQFGRLQTEITNHKLEWFLIVRIIILTEQEVYKWKYETALHELIQLIMHLVELYSVYIALPKMVIFLCLTCTMSVSKIKFVHYNYSASSKVLSFFNKDARGEVQTVTFDNDEVKKIFYGSFHKVMF